VARAPVSKTGDGYLRPWPCKIVIVSTERIISVSYVLILADIKRLVNALTSSSFPQCVSVCCDGISYAAL